MISDQSFACHCLLARIQFYLCVHLGSDISYVASLSGSRCDHLIMKTAMSFAMRKQVAMKSAFKQLAANAESGPVSSSGSVADMVG